MVRGRSLLPLFSAACSATKGSIRCQAAEGLFSLELTGSLCSKSAGEACPLHIRAAFAAGWHGCRNSHCWLLAYHSCQKMSMGGPPGARPSRGEVLNGCLHIRRAQIDWSPRETLGDSQTRGKKQSLTSSSSVRGAMPASPAGTVLSGQEDGQIGSDSFEGCKGEAAVLRACTKGGLVLRVDWPMVRRFGLVYLSGIKLGFQFVVFFQVCCAAHINAQSSDFVKCWCLSSSEVSQ